MIRILDQVTVGCYPKSVKKAMPCPVFNQMKNKETFNNLTHKQPTIEAIDLALMKLNIRKSSPREGDGNERHEMSAA